MDTFFKKINLVTNLSKDRLEQLSRMNYQNEQIEKHSNKCSSNIIKYFINMSKINELHSKEMYKVKCIKIFSHLEKHMKDIDTNLNLVDNALSSDNFCNDLQNVIRFQNTILSNLILEDSN